MYFDFKLIIILIFGLILILFKFNEELMKKYAKGDINSRLSVTANLIYPTYILKGDSKNMMIDSGINLFGPLYIESIKEILDDLNNLDYLFLTHSHYDHVGSVPYLKRNMEKLLIGGHEKINELMQKQSVLDLMNRLSEVQRDLFKDIVGEEDVHLEPFSLDLLLNDVDSFDLGNLTCEVYGLPGHTRDSLGFFVPELKAFFPGEAVGVPEGKTGEGVQVEFLTSFDDYTSSIKKVQKLNPEIICMAHGWVFTEEDVSEFLMQSYEESFKYRELIEKYLRKSGNNVEMAIELMVKKEYDEKGTIYQERNAYLMNLSAQVNHIASII